MNFLWLVFFLQLKHFVVDFLLQTPYMYKNKGTFGHPGGLLHSAQHAITTALIFAIVGGERLFLVAAVAGIFDGIAHYGIDWAKVNINQYFFLTPQEEKFWYLLGLDQFLHQVTYILMYLILIMTA